MSSKKNSGLASYLAKYQGSAGGEQQDYKTTKKKKKKAVPAAATALKIIDEDEKLKTSKLQQDQEDDEYAPTIVNAQIFKAAQEAKTKKQEIQSRWKEVPLESSASATSNTQISAASNSAVAEDDELVVPRRRIRHDSPVVDEEPAVRQASPPSPPRRRRERHDTPPPASSPSSPPRRPRRRLDSDEESSPPRRPRHRDDKEAVEDLEPPRRRQRHDSPPASPSPTSPPRRRQRHDSPPAESPERTSAAPSSPIRQPLAKPIGLRKAEEIAEDLELQRQRAREQFEKMDPSLTGREADIVYRDPTTGKKISKEEYTQLKEQQQKKKKKQDEVEIKREFEWGKGLVQKQAQEAVAEQIIAEQDKSFSRYEDDPELDKLYREQIREGDPMAQYILEEKMKKLKKKQKKKRKKKGGDGSDDNEEGDLLSERKIYQGHFPPNRYGIRPGWRWDGVDRSNGFEKKYFISIQEKKAKELAAYKWSSEDM